MTQIIRSFIPRTLEWNTMAVMPEPLAQEAFRVAVNDDARGTARPCSLRGVRQ